MTFTPIRSTSPSSMNLDLYQRIETIRNQRAMRVPIITKGVMKAQSATSDGRQYGGASSNV
ncbi:MAG: hypothetical protein ACK55Z_25020 [bacterium]